MNSLTFAGRIRGIPNPSPENPRGRVPPVVSQAKRYLLPSPGFFPYSGCFLLSRKPKKRVRSGAKFRTQSDRADRQDKCLGGISLSIAGVYFEALRVPAPHAANVPS